jgi:cyclic pyranopterin phosphate synthase
MPRASIGDGSAFLNNEDIMSFEEILRLVKIFVGLGVSKVRLTGGEPLLRDNLTQLIASLNQLPDLQDIAMTTNGSLLRNMVVSLKESGLKRLTVSLNSLNPDRFQENSDSSIPLDRIISSLESARNVGFKNIKLNCVLRRGVNDMDIIPLASFARENGYVIRFIEFMDVGNQNSWCLDSVVPATEVADLISKKWPAERVYKRSTNCVAQHWRYKDGSGEFGLIASVTEPFCADCDRVRLSADGSLYLCLFAADSLNVKKIMREGVSTTDLSEIIKAYWSQRSDRYSEIRSKQTVCRPKAEMFHLGG